MVMYKGKNYYQEPRGYWVREERRGNVRTVVYLHRLIWEDNKGPIPQDWVVHHIDGDTSNYALTNLMIMHYTTHHSLHFKMYRLENGIVGLPEGIRKWQKTPEAKKHFTKLVEYARSCIPLVQRDCEVCGKTFVRPGKNTVNCSTYCLKKKWRDKQRLLRKTA